MKQNAILFLCSVVLLSCTQKAPPPNWTAAMCNPYGYRIYAPHVDYYYRGKWINSVESSVSIGNGSWGFPQPGRSMGSQFEWPDSVHVSYYGFNDKLEVWKFEGGASLPTGAIKKLFENGYNWDGEPWDYSYITTGMAPGGHVCVWIDHIELTRFTITPVELWRTLPPRYTIDSLEESVNARYLRENPINYKVWNKPDERYDMEFSFCTDEEEVSYFGANYLSKEGSVVQLLQYVNLESCNNPDTTFHTFKGVGGYQQMDSWKQRDHRLPFPHTLEILWKNGDDVYSTELPLFRIKDVFVGAYIDQKTRKKEHYRRFLFKPINRGSMGEVYLVGPNKKTLIMRFSANKAALGNDNIFRSGGFAKDIQWFLPDKAE